MQQFAKTFVRYTNDTFLDTFAQQLKTYILYFPRSFNCEPRDIVITIIDVNLGFTYDSFMKEFPSGPIYLYGSGGREISRFCIKYFIKRLHLHFLTFS